MGVHRGGGGVGDGGWEGATAGDVRVNNGGGRLEGLSGCTGPLLPERCLWVGMVKTDVGGVVEGQLIITALHIISTSLKNSL